MNPTNISDRAVAWPGAITVSKPKMTSDAEGTIRLVVVDDDDDFREAAAAELVDLGFAVESFADGASMLAALANGLAADLIVLDWSLPAMSGIDLLPRLRRDGIKLPVVVLTGRSSCSSEHLAFDRGALDFVDKTRGVSILAKRIGAIIQSSKRPAALEVDETQHCGRLMLKPRVGRAFWDSIDLNLTVTEFNIVRLLSSNIGNHVTYRAVYDCVHHVGFMAGSGAHGYQTNVRSSIRRIRSKFRLVDPEFAEIENFSSFGYRWRPSEGPTP